MTKRPGVQDSQASVPVESEYAAYRQQGLKCADLTAESIFLVYQCEAAQKSHLGEGQSDIPPPPTNLHDLYSQVLFRSPTTAGPSTQGRTSEPEDITKASELKEATWAATICAKTNLDELRLNYREPEFLEQVMCRLVGGSNLLEDYTKGLMQRIDETIIEDSDQADVAKDVKVKP